MELPTSDANSFGIPTFIWECITLSMITRTIIYLTCYIFYNENARRVHETCIKLSAECRFLCKSYKKRTNEIEIYSKYFIWCLENVYIHIIILRQSYTIMLLKYVKNSFLWHIISQDIHFTMKLHYMNVYSVYKSNFFKIRDN